MIIIEEWEREFLDKHYGPGWQTKVLSDLHCDLLIKTARNTSEYKFAKLKRSKNNLFANIKKALCKYIP
jgi:hypothetical protein